jgi:hypothetical protein
MNIEYQVQTQAQEQVQTKGYIMLFRVCPHSTQTQIIALEFHVPFPKKKNLVHVENNRA